MGKGVQIEEIVLGEGAVARKGARVTVCYDGFLSGGDAFQRGVTASFVLGRREVIAGLEAGVEGMRAGGRRRIRVSPHLGYGGRGVEGVIPANAVLVFDVRLLAVEEGQGRVAPRSV
jgi:FKBP-type peptidyl-prolyl cis-trans isomerase